MHPDCSLGDCAVPPRSTDSRLYGIASQLGRNARAALGQFRPPTAGSQTCPGASAFPQKADHSRSCIGRQLGRTSEAQPSRRRLTQQNLPQTAAAALHKPAWAARSVACLRHWDRDGALLPAPYCGNCIGRPWSGYSRLCAAVVCDGNPARLRVGLQYTNNVVVSPQRRTAPAMGAPSDVLGHSASCSTRLLVVGPTQNLDMRKT